MDLSIEPRNKQEALERAKYWINEAWVNRISMGIGGMQAYRDCMSKSHKYEKLAKELSDM